MKRHPGFLAIPEETVFEIVDEYTVRFTFPEPDGLALVKFGGFAQMAPAFFTGHEFAEQQLGIPLRSWPLGDGSLRVG
jgi:ABC-type transport system substrate-binding protein